MNSPIQHFFCPSPRGLESLLSDELEQLGAASATVTAGGVAFSGPLTLAYRVNLESRIASRVLWRVDASDYRSEDDIYRAVHSLSWGRWFTPERTIMVKVAAQKCPLRSLDFVTLKIKDGICDSFRERTGRRPSVDTQEPDVRIHAFLDETRITLYLDTSGPPLFQRGLRKAAVEAPVRENLAAGILKLAGWTPGTPLLDPMCGSGTFLLEAAQMALRMAPGIRRHFAFEQLENFDAAAWEAMRAEAVSRQLPPTPLLIFGSDLSGRALQAARTNIETAGLEEAIQLKQVDILDMVPPAPEGILVTNPPYGVRLGDQQALAALYPRLGDVLKRKFAGWRAYLFTSDLRLPKLIRLTASKRTPLFNGALECRLFEYKLVAGGMRRKPADRPPGAD